MSTAQFWIDRLQLRKHPEGGYYRETYRSAEVIAREHLPERFSGDRAFSTAIYFLLEGEDFSAFHRIEQDEVWHFYDGTPLTVHVIDPSGKYSTIHLGRDLDRGQAPQAVVRAEDFFAAAVDAPASFSLVGCTVAPGFHFDDFEMPGREALCALFPQHRKLIERFTRAGGSPG